ncbi:DUF1552 domain-containing protein [Pseudomonas mucidolens]|uniref:Tat (Twin-arginine translocation) pathway signal sequence n=1 Tax=Pseudomonas mucidolens TaxID=46679 RepID=A0A1H2MUT4_9PSED|nr:DUF1552 domain-containing protein [Pseudomonas mucidolens]SDU96930.1 Protein of unknown function [Pseudomonas mucidolens]SQH33185.1 tat (twin-arginine translocation) pathway signal sequence domain-containing protein [Pseudomonas mucidolens]
MGILKSRRRFLAALVAAGVYGPLTQFGLTRMALAGQTQEAKLKIVFVVVPDGLAVDSYQGGGFGDGRGLWYPEADGADTTQFQLNEVSAELQAYRTQSLYLRGIILGPGNVGHNGWNWVLRDTESRQSSIDIVLGQVLPGSEPSHRSLFAGPHAGIDGTPWFVSWQGTAIRTPYRDPQLMAQALFSSPGAAAKDQAKGTELLDVALEDIRDLQDKLTGAQRQKLQTHLDSVEQVIKDIEQSTPPVGECKPVVLEPLPWQSAEFRNQIQGNHHQVVATALSCGITRVATIQIGRSAESLNIIDVSPTSNPHECAHRRSGEAFWKGTRQWYVRQVKLFMDELARYQDPHVPTDKLLDHTLVVLTSEMADGAPEHMIDMPVVLMGGASGLLKSGDGVGRYLNITSQADREHHSGNPVIGKRFVDMQRIWATIAKAAGTSVPYTGNVDVVSGIFTNV